MPGKIKAKNFFVRFQVLCHTLPQRAPEPRPAVAHFQRIPKHGVEEALKTDFGFAGFLKERE